MKSFRIIAGLGLLVTAACSGSGERGDDVGLDGPEDAVLDSAETDSADPIDADARQEDVSTEGDSSVDVSDDIGADSDAGDTRADADSGTTPCDYTQDCPRLSLCCENICCDRTGALCGNHGECGHGAACFDGVCVDRRSVSGEVLLTPVSTALDRHTVVGLEERNPFALGAGGALLDFDADGLLDIFVSGSRPLGSRGCLYRNISGAAIGFEADAVCSRFTQINGGAAVDLDRDGRHELVTLSPSRILHWSWDDSEWTRTDISLSVSDPERVCNASGAVPLDADRDGDLDLYVLCDYDPARELLGMNNLLVEVEDGEFIGVWSQERMEALDDNGSTLAVVVADLNEDGLTDIVMLNDTFSSNGVANTNWEPGGIAWACSPMEECEWRLTRLGVGPAAWGSYMGGTLTRFADGRELLYLTDHGADRLVEVTSGELPVEEAVSLGAVDEVLDRSKFSWGAYTEDFDQNGLDDIFVIQGDAQIVRIDNGEDFNHTDRVVLQTDSGLEVRRRVEFAPGTNWTYTGRGGAAVDFDLDGRFEFVTIPFRGSVRLETESAPEWGGARATLVPRTRYIHQLGAGFSLWSESGWRARGGQGSPRFGSNPYVTVLQGNGILRFPSGAAVPYVATHPGLTTVEEPEWLTIERTDGAVRVVIDEVYWPLEFEAVSIAHRTESETSLVPLEQVGEEWTGFAEGGQIMLRIGDRWVGRWWTL